MTDSEQYLKDQMFYDENLYRPEVRSDADGFFRWRFTLDQFHDRKTVSFQIKYWALFAVAGAVLGVLLAEAPAELIRQDPAHYRSLLLQRRLLYAFLGYAAFLLAGLAITGLVRLLDGGPAVYWYRMNNDFIQIKPSGRGSGINPFDEVKQVGLYPEVNEIRLISRWGKCPVLVRAEDYDLVKNHILAHIPEDAVVSGGSIQ